MFYIFLNKRSSAAANAIAKGPIAAAHIVNIFDKGVTMTDSDQQIASEFRKPINRKFQEHKV